MPDKHQFTMKWLLVEVTLAALLLAIVRLFFFVRHDEDTDLYVQLLVFVGWPSAFACFGAMIGGMFGRFAWGAAWALLALMVFLLVSLLVSAAINGA